MDTNHNMPLLKNTINIFLHLEKIEKKKISEIYLVGTIKNYENGNYKGSPKLDIVNNLCKILKCDVDYLLGNMDCKKHDIQFIHDETGLSEKTIENLLNVNHHSKDKKITLLNLNYLLGENSEKGFNLLALIYHYLFGNYDRALDDNDSITLMDKTGIAHNGVEIPISDLNDLFMPMIQGQLQRIKNDIQNQAKKWENYGKYIPTEKDYKELLETTEIQNKRARKMIRKHKNNPDKQKFWDDIIKENNNELIEMRNEIDRNK